MKCEKWDCSENAELIIKEVFNSKSHYLCPIHAYQFKKNTPSVMLFLPEEEYSIHRLKRIIENIFKQL